VNVSDHTDHRSPIARLPIRIDAFVDRALIRPMLSRERFVDDRHGGSSRPIGAREIASGDERNSGRVKVSGHRDRVLGVRHLHVRSFGLALDGERATPVLASHRKRIHGAHLGHTGNGRGRAARSIEQRDEFCRVVVAAERERQLERDDVGGRESRPHRL
jgi:hypothetical protein